MRSLGIRIVNTLLLGLCSFQVATVFNRIAAETLRTTPVYDASSVREDSAPPSGTDDRQAIIDRNLFGAEIVPQLVVAEPVETVEETKLPLTLEATIAATETTSSRASILNTRAGTNMVVGVGDPLEGYEKVIVALIERGRVVLQNEGRHEELLLEEATPAPTPPRPSAAKRRGRKPSTARALTQRDRRSPAKRPVSRPPALRDLEAATNPMGTAAPFDIPLAEGIRERLEAGEFSQDELREMLEEAAEKGKLSGELD